MQKHKHIKYTKLNPIISKTIPSPAESPLCRTSESTRHRAWRFLFMRFALIGSLESPPSNLLRATRKPDVLVLSEIHGKGTGCG